MHTQMHLDTLRRRALIASGRLRRVWATVSLDAGERESASLVRASAIKASLLGDNAPRCWVHLCCYGDYKGHPAGPFTFDLDCFDTFVANFDAQANQIPWTIGHPWETTESEGWLLALEVRGQGEGPGAGLWGLVEWTEEAAQAIRAGRWKFCSVVFDLEGRDRKTDEKIGPELIEVGLTNTPFIDGQTPIVLLERMPAMTKKKRDYTTLAKKTGSTADSLQAVMDEVAAALDMDSADTDEIVARVKAIADAIKALSPKATTPPTGDVGDAAKMSADDRKKWVAALAKWAHLKLDDTGMPDQAMIGGGTSAPGGDDDTQSAALLEAIQKIGAAASMDDSALASWLAANADAVVALISGASTTAPAAAMSRELGDLRVKLNAAEAGRTELAAKVKELSDDLATRQKAAEDAAKAARDAEVERLLDEARKDGRLMLGAPDAAGKREPSKQEASVRAAFAHDHKLGVELLANLPKIVPTGTVTEEAGAKPGSGGPPGPGGGNEHTGNDPNDLKTFDFKPRSSTEQKICAMHVRNKKMLASALHIHRSALAGSPARV